MELVLALCFGVFAGAIIIWAWWAINPQLKIREQNIEKRSEHLNRQLEQLDQQRKNIQQEVELQLDAERARISSELHDDIIQRLSGIRLSLLHIISIHTIPEETATRIKQLTTDLTETIEITRVLIWGLSLAEVEGKSLVAMLGELCSKIGRTSLLKISFTSVMEEWERPVSDFVKKEIHRIVQESIHNAIKYSNGWKINVKTQWHHDRVSIFIEDDGEGIKKKPSSGFGIENLYRRASEMNATLKIVPNSPHGTIVKLELGYDSCG